MDKLYRNRRFGLALLICLSAITALFQGTISGGEFIALSGVVLGMYGGIADSKNSLE